MVWIALWFSLLSFDSNILSLRLEENIEGELTTESPVIGSTLYIADEAIKLGNKAYKLSSQSTSLFNDKAELIEYFDCQYLFEEVPFGVKGHITELKTDEAFYNGELQLVHLYNNQKIDVIIAGVRWISDRQMGLSHTDLAPTVEEEVIEYKLKRYLKALEADTVMYSLTDVDDEIIVEQLLTRDAASQLTVIPAKLETVTEIILDYEENVCKDLYVEYEEVSYQALKSEGYFNLTVVPHEYETVSEQVISTFAYGDVEVFHPEYAVSSLVIPLADGYDKLTKSWLGDCESYKLDCVDWEINWIESRDTILDVLTFMCPDDFMKISQAGLCYREVEVPATFETRQFEGLVKDETVTEQWLEPQYEVLTYTRITNEESLPDSCIRTVYKPRHFQKLAEPASIEVKEIPAIYETVTRVRPDGIPSLIVPKTQFTYDTINFLERISHAKYEPETEVVDPIFYSDEDWETIKSKLITEDFLKVENKDNQDSLYKALYEYSCWQLNSIGNHTSELQNSIGINITNHFLNVENDEPPKTFEPFLRDIINYRLYTCEGTTETSVKTETGTIIAGIQYSLIRSNGIENRFGHSLGSDKILMLDDDLAAHVVVDFSLNHCDERFPVTHLTTDTIWLDIRNTYTDENNRRIIEFENQIIDCYSNSLEYFKFIEGVGTNAGLNYFMEGGEVGPYLQCFLQNGIQEYGTGEENSCQVTTHISDPNDLSRKVFPNPTDNIINVPQGHTILSIRDMMGTKVISDINSEQVGLSSLPDGVYTLTSKDKQGDLFLHLITKI